MEQVGKIPQIFSGNNAAAPQAVQLTPITCKSFLAEYVVRTPNLVVHLYRKERGPLWLYEDAQVIWEAMIEVFGLKGRENQLTVEFVPEMYSWCVTIEKIAVIAPPSHEKVVRALELFEQKRNIPNASVDRAKKEPHTKQKS